MNEWERSWELLNRPVEYSSFGICCVIMIFCLLTGVAAYCIGRVRGWEHTTWCRRCKRHRTCRDCGGRQEVP